MADPWPKPRHIQIIRQLSDAKLRSFRGFKKKTALLGTENNDNRTATPQDASSVQTQLVVRFVAAKLAKLIKASTFSWFAHCRRASEGPLILREGLSYRRPHIGALDNRVRFV